MVEALGQFHFTPERYLDLMREEVPRYDELQERTAAATVGRDARRILELGTGTGETTRRVLALHPGATVVGIDASDAMLAVARRELGAALDARVARLEEALPPGPFDLVVSALAVHHLDAAGKQELLRRVADVLRPGGRFVLADVVVPMDPGDAVTPLSEGFDLPDTVDDHCEWLRGAGFVAHVAWADKDLAILVADLR
jgi:tRNA (cmo5U34)-methyltransferase